MRLKNKTCIITGAAQGIGLSTALKFAEEGANVVVCDLKPDGVDAAVALVRARGAQTLGFALDVTDREALDHMAAAVKERFGSIDVLVNNAGITKDARLQKMTLAQFDAVIDVNLRGVFHGSQAVLPAMLAQGAGSIVNIASVHGHKIIPGCFPYPVAKHGLIGLTRSLGIEYAARGIRVNSISPGLILVPRIEAWFEREPAARARQTALLPPRRIGTPEEVAYTALFLASDEARFINATDILIDGGRSQVYHD